MNETPDKKTAVIKSLAIIGFVAAIVICAYLAVLAVRYAPLGFRQLASLAETVYGPQKTFDASVDKNVVDAGTSLTLSWQKMPASGTYDISYTCADGLSVEARNADNAIVPVSCDTRFTLPNTKETSLLFESDAARYKDTTLTVRYTPESNPEHPLTKEILITVVNPTVDTTTATSSVATSTPITPAATSTEREPQTPVTVTPTTPVSDPLGYADLSVSYIGSGMVNSANILTPQVLSSSTRSAVRFSVTNTGTKTSGIWIYTITLPDSNGSNHTSTIQPSLLPGERETITVTFTTGTPGTFPLRILVAESSEINTANNAVVQNILVR